MTKWRRVHGQINVVPREAEPAYSRPAYGAEDDGLSRIGTDVVYMKELKGEGALMAPQKLDWHKVDIQALARGIVVALFGDGNTLVHIGAAAMVVEPIIERAIRGQEQMLTHYEMSEKGNYKLLDELRHELGAPAGYSILERAIELRIELNNLRGEKARADRLADLAIRIWKSYGDTGHLVFVTEDEALALDAGTP